MNGPPVILQRRSHESTNLLFVLYEQCNGMRFGHSISKINRSRTQGLSAAGNVFAVCPTDQVAAEPSQT